MQLSSDAQIPDGLLAANALLREKPHQGVPSWNLAPHQGIDERNSTAAIGIRAALHLERVRSRYTGKERDAESGNDYFEARHYSSTTGRFMSPDWSAEEEPIPYAQMDDPQSLNLYSYVQNNPLGRVDADGHCPWCALGGAALAVGAEIIADKITGKPITLRGVVGAAVGGAIIGGSAGLATEEGVAIQIAIAGNSSIVGGIVERGIKTGSADEALKPTEVLKDAGTGMLGGAIGKGVESAVEKVAGGEVKALIKQFDKLRSANTTKKILKQIAKAQKPVEAKVKVAAKGSDLATDAANRTHDKRKP